MTQHDLIYVTHKLYDKYIIRALIYDIASIQTYTVYEYVIYIYKHSIYPVPPNPLCASVWENTS